MAREGGKEDNRKGGSRKGGNRKKDNINPTCSDNRKDNVRK